MIRLTASVPPLLIRWVSKRARMWSFHIFRVRPSRATSGMGQSGKEAMTFAAMARPSEGVSAWYVERTCW